MGRISIHLIAVTALPAISIAVAGCHGKHSGESPQVPEVSVARPLTDSIVLRQSYPATLAATQSTDVVARVNGQIKQLLFDDGQYVTAGQPLYIIESTTYRDRMQQAQGALETALAEHDYATRQSAAMQKALEAEAVSKMDVIQAESQVRQSEAAIKQARAELETARTMLGYCTVRAPISGKISETLYGSGAYVNGEGAPVALTKIYADKQLYVMFSVETDRYMQMSYTRQGRQADYEHVPISFGDSITGTYYGRLDYASPDVSQSTGTVTLRLIVDNPDGVLRSGMFGTVDLPYASDPDALLIKDASISTDQLGKFVYILGDSDKIVYTPIEVGDLYHDTLRVVTKGLKPDDRYVTTALLKVRDGMKVKPLEQPLPKSR